MIRRAAGDVAFSRVRQAEVWPGADICAGVGLRDYIRRRAGSYCHPVGTCRMGSDDGAVVDPELRAGGLDT
jgi:choline dehydrogenase